MNNSNLALKNYNQSDEFTSILLNIQKSINNISATVDELKESLQEEREDRAIMHTIIKREIASMRGELEEIKLDMKEGK
ncbi:hypothetical protein [Bacillus massiliigorillae]|uniref:hypothetical protein n=1 Tax=Bacillus massiliigorillae TaxID=1243664 RepID=UPI00039A08D4|nr:hypothetical protein [Bacillus massiliigorillae]